VVVQTYPLGVLVDRMEQARTKSPKED
jgi:hypothetical protein